MSFAQLDSQLCFALYSASSHLTGVYRKLLEPHGLTYTQFVVLMALWEQDNIAISRLAERTNLTKATMTPLLKRLEQKQLIQRLQVEGNERQKSIVLTEQGRELSSMSLTITEQVFCSTGLSQQEAEQMIVLCNKLKGDEQ